MNTFNLSKAFLLLMGILYFAISDCSAQAEITVQHTDGNNEPHIITDLGKLFFEDNYLMIAEDDQIFPPVELSSIRKILVKDISETSLSSVESNTFSIYPNPSKDLININIDSEDTLLNIAIYSTSGQLLLQGQYENKKPIDVSAFPSGMYLIRVNNKTSKFCKL